MADERKNDPFKPVQPSIPGLAPVSAARVQDGVASSRAPDGRRLPESQRLLLTAVGTFVGLITIGGLVYWGRTASTKSRVSTEAVAPSAELAAKPIEKEKRPEAVATGPGVIANTTDLSKTWSAKRFLFRSPSSEVLPALVVRLPDGQYWGFSLREPFGSCELAYETDLKKLESDYGFRASHPMVVDPCSQTVFDLLQYAPAESEGGLVRGAIVKGAGVRPPLAIEIRVEGKEVRAIRSE